MVPPTGIEPVMTGYQPIVIPFNYRGINLEYGVRFELTVITGLQSVAFDHSAIRT